MENNNNYRERRIKNRKACLEKEKADEDKYKRYLEKMSEQCDNIAQSIDNVLNNKDKILLEVEKYCMVEEKLKDSRNSDSKIFSGGELVAVLLHDNNASKALSDGRRAFRKHIEKTLQKLKRPLQNYLANISFHIYEASKMMKNKIFESVQDSISNPFKALLVKILDASQIENYAKFDEFLEILKTDLKEDFLNITGNYKEAIKSYRPQIDDKRKDTARLNISILEEEVKSIKNLAVKEKNDYLNSLEGNLLAYALFKLEEKKTEGEDPDYEIFLFDRAEDKLSLLRSKNKEDIEANLQNLLEKEHLNDSEYNFIKITLDSELEKNEDKAKKDLEDIQLRALVLSDYNIPDREAFRIAKLAKDENIDKISISLSMGFGRDLANLLIKDNPEIFFMEDKQTIRYINRLKETINLAGRYNSIDDFNPLKSPKNFSSLDALKDTRRKLYSIIQESAPISNGQNQNAEGELSEIERIKFGLARGGYDPDMALAILGRGFYFRNQYFTGDHRISEEHLEKNTRKDRNIDFEKRYFKRELRKLVTSGAVLYNRGYSLNDKTKEISSNVLRGAVQYTLTHHPLEEEN